jgi:hypothetical protein
MSLLHWCVVALLLVLQQSEGDPSTVVEQVTPDEFLGGDL